MTDTTTPFGTLYAERLMTPAVAAAVIPSGAKVAMALGVGQPPALLKALADRAEAREVADINIYYLLSTAIAGETVLRFDLTDRLRPHSLFHGAIERKLEARQGRYCRLERAQVRRNLAAGLGGCTKRGAQSSGTDGTR